MSAKNRKLSFSVLHSFPWGLFFSFPQMHQASAFQQRTFVWLQLRTCPPGWQSCYRTERKTPKAIRIIRLWVELWMMREQKKRKDKFRNNNAETLLCCPDDNTGREWWYDMVVSAADDDNARSSQIWLASDKNNNMLPHSALWFGSLLDAGVGKFPLLRQCRGQEINWIQLVLVFSAKMDTKVPKRDPQPSPTPLFGSGKHCKLADVAQYFWWKKIILMLSWEDKITDVLACTD